MNKIIIIILIVGILIGGISIGITSNYNKEKSDKFPSGLQDNKQNKNTNKENCLADDCLLVNNLNYLVGKLSNGVKSSLDKAIQDEYKTRSTYEAVIKIWFRETILNDNQSGRTTYKLIKGYYL